jgi:hypothetical protein
MENKKEDKNTLIPVAGLYIRKTEEGEPYMTGKWGQVYVCIFKNKEKDGEESPDFILNLSPVRGSRKPEEKDAIWNDIFQLSGES